MRTCVNIREEEEEEEEKNVIIIIIIISRVCLPSTLNRKGYVVLMKSLENLSRIFLFLLRSLCLMCREHNHMIIIIVFVEYHSQSSFLLFCQRKANSVDNRNTFIVNEERRKEPFKRRSGST